MSAPERSFFFVEVTRPPGQGIGLVKAALALGFKVVALVSNRAINENLVDLGIEIVEVVTQRPEVVAETIAGHRTSSEVAGVSTAHEFYAPVVAEAAALLGLPGPDARSIMLGRRKDMQRRVLAAAGVRIPRFKICETLEEARAAISEVGAPLVVKTVALTEGYGVRWCTSIEEAVHHADRILKGDFNATRLPVPGGLPRLCLVESPLWGKQVTVEVFDGRAQVMTRTGLGPRPGFLEISHLFPHGFDAAVEERAYREAEAAVACLNLGWGPIHVELRIEDGIPWVIEVNARLAGGGIPDVLRAAIGLDLCRATVQRYAGDPVDLRRHGGAGAAELRLMVLDREGVVGKLGDVSAAREVPHIAAAEVSAKTGDKLEKRGRNSDAVGWALAAGSDWQTCAAALDRALALATPSLVDGRPGLIGADIP